MLCSDWALARVLPKIGLDQKLLTMLGFYWEGRILGNRTRQDSAGENRSFFLNRVEDTNGGKASGVFRE